MGPGFGLWISWQQALCTRSRLRLDQLAKTTGRVELQAWTAGIRMKAMPFTAPTWLAKRIALQNGVPDENSASQRDGAQPCGAAACPTSVYSHIARLPWSAAGRGAAAASGLRPGGRLVVTACKLPRAVVVITEDGTAFGGAKQLKVDQHVTEGTRAAL